MNDLISRQAAITIPVTPKEDREYQTYNLDDVYEQAWEDLQKRINQLRSAQPEHERWIPCSERLPDKQGIYLCTVGADYRNPREMIYAPDNFINDKDSNAWMSIDGYRVMNWFVIAWMPMPKPYMMDEEEQDESND